MAVSSTVGIEKSTPNRVLTSVQLFCSQIAVVASRPAGSTTMVRVGSSATDESSTVAVLESGDVVAVGEAGVDTDASLVGEAEVDVLIVDDVTTPPADAVPVVGVEQATVKTAVDSRAAAAMPWRRFTSNTFESRPAAAGEVWGECGLAHARASVALTGRRTRAASPRLRTFRKEMRCRSL